MGGNGVNARGVETSPGAERESSEGGVHAGHANRPTLGSSAATSLGMMSVTFFKSTVGRSSFLMSSTALPNPPTASCVCRANASAVCGALARPDILTNLDPTRPNLLPTSPTYSPAA